VRWLIVGAISLALALGGLAWMLSAPSDQVSVTKVAEPSEPEPDVVPAQTPIQPSIPPAREPTAPAEDEPRSARDEATSSRTPSLASSDGSAVAPEDPALAPYRGQPPTHRRIRTRVAESRLAKGNYQGALESGLQLIELYPEMMTGYKVTVTALCALGDPPRAREIFAQVQPKDVREGIQKSCTELGTTLTP
jgi:hypothetical protein